MKFEEDPLAGRRGEFDKQIKRGWFLGSDEFRKRLDQMLEGRTDNDNYRSRQRRDHSEWEAERLLKNALDELGMNEEDLLAARSVLPEKQAVAWLLKSHTSVTGTWIAHRLEMGHRVNASRAISRFRDAVTREEKALKKRMLQCTG